MNKTVILLILCLTLLLPSCAAFVVEEKVTGDTTSALSEVAPTPEYSDKVSADVAELGKLDPSQNYENQLSQLPQMDFTKKYFGDRADGQTVYFSIASTLNIPVFSSADEISGACVSAALNAVEDIYNVDIISMTFTGEEMEAKMKESVLSKTYLADLLCLDAPEAAKYANAEYCKKIGSLPFVSEKSVYSHTNFFETPSKLSGYAWLNDSSYLLSDAYCLYFDPETVGSDLYKDALDKKLTWELVRAKADSVGRGIFCAADAESLFRLSTGGRYVLSGGKLTLDADHLLEGVTDEKITAEKVLSSAFEAIFGQKSEAEPVFFIDTVGNYKNYLHQKTPYGILPLPTYREGADTFGFVDAKDIYYYLCPLYTALDEGTGIILSALGASYSQREAEMLLELIRDSVRDNGSLLVSHMLLSRPLWDAKFVFEALGPDPTPDPDPIPTPDPDPKPTPNPEKQA